MTVARNLLKNLLDMGFDLLGVVDKETARCVLKHKRIHICHSYLDMVKVLLVTILYYKPKICHFNFPPLLLTPLLFIMKLLKVKIVYSFHGGILLEQGGKWNKSLFIIQCKHLYDVIIANSKYSAKLLLSLKRNLDKKIVIIPNGVEFEEFQICHPPLKGNPSLLYVGRLEHIKGVDILLKAIALVSRNLPEVYLHIVGGGSKLKEIKELIYNLGIEWNVTLHGVVEEEKKKKLYAGADIVVIPSRSEPFGIVALEAMAAGKPLIVSDRGALPELVKHNYNGLVVELTPQTFAKAILDLVKNKNMMVRISENNRKTAKLYDWKRISRNYVSLYEILKGDERVH